jgi:hypothetical protein
MGFRLMYRLGGGDCDFESRPIRIFEKKIRNFKIFKSRNNLKISRF